MENKNHGVIIEVREADWVAGVSSGLTYQEVVKDGNWTAYLPTSEKQLINNKFETFACVTFSAHNIIETYVDMMVANGLISPVQIQKLKDWGYFDANGKLNVSDCFTAILSGTGYKDGRYGNSAGIVLDCIRKNGLVPQTMLDRSNANTADEWYAPIPQDVIDFGKNFLSVFTIQYEQIKSGTCSSIDIDNTLYHLKQGPIQILAHCAENDSFPVLQNSNCESQHATELYAIDTCIEQFDTYNNFNKRLDKSYVIPYLIKVVVSVNTTQTVEQQKIAILKQMIAVYQQIITIMKNKACTVAGWMNKKK